MSTTNLTRWAIPVGLFLLALAVRLPGLAQFLTPDEFLWIDRSRNFLAGMLNPAYACTSPANHTGFEQAVGLACTLRTGHPGVTTMWTGTLGIVLRYLADGLPGPLFDYALSIQTNPLDPRFIAPARLPTVFLAGLWVAGIYGLVWRLAGSWRLALVAGLLTALDPFQIAYSRVIHHDMLETIFMTTSFLAALVYWGQGGSRRWLVFSGVSAGFAFLSKQPGFMLTLFVALLGLGSLLRQWRAGAPAVGRVVLDGLLWFGCAAAVFVVAWPAMWVIPADAVRTIFTIGAKYASEGHAKGNYFLGTISRDPGALFYPVTWLVRSSPLVWLGLIAVAGFGWRRGPATPARAQKADPAADQRRLLAWLLTFVVIFAVLMTVVVNKKQERYLAPAFPLINIVAAAGLIQILNALPRILPGRAAWQRWVKRHALPMALIIITLLQGIALVRSYPYYLTYYNPLLGGVRGAERMVTIGWGEGLDLAAAYFNQKPNAEQLRVSSWYQSTFAPFFKGQAISYSQEKGKALAGDYVVFYVNQWQRRFPDEEFYRYFETRYEPEKIIPINGVDYVAIYPAPGIRHYVEDRVDENRRVYRGIAALLGWDWPGADDPDRPSVAAGEALAFRLYWEYLGKVPEERFFFRLLGPDGGIWAESASEPVFDENGDPAAWREGQIITEAGELIVPPGTPPGEYRLQIGFYTRAPAVLEGELTFDLPPDEARVQVTPATTPPAVAELPLEARLDAPLADLRLLGVDLPDEPTLRPGRPWQIDLYWLAAAAPGSDYQVRLALLDAGGQARWTWEATPLAGFYPSSGWRSGEIVRSPLTVRPSRRTPGGQLDLALTLLDEAGQALGQVTLGPVQVEGRPRSFSVATPEVPLGAIFADAVELVGFNSSVASAAGIQPGDEMTLELVWRSLAPLEADYTVTVQLLGPDGRIYAQQDGPPLGGVAPTSTWTPGEVLVDTYHLAVSAGAPPGEYRLLMGLYLLDTGERLPLTEYRAGAALADDALLLQTWSIP